MCEWVICPRAQYSYTTCMSSCWQCIERAGLSRSMFDQNRMLTAQPAVLQRTSLLLEASASLQALGPVSSSSERPVSPSGLSQTMDTSFALRKRAHVSCAYAMCSKLRHAERMPVGSQLLPSDCSTSLTGRAIATKVTKQAKLLWYWWMHHLVVTPPAQSWCLEAPLILLAPFK